LRCNKQEPAEQNKRFGVQLLRVIDGQARHMDETLTLRILGWGMSFLLLSLFALYALSLPH
jgi:hypothetical protein